MRYRDSTGRRNLLVQLSLALLTGSISVSSAPAIGGMKGKQIGGFCVSSAGLPASAIDAWHATVLVEKRRFVFGKDGRPRWRVKHGSGVVVRVNDGDPLAVIVTNAHNVTCGDRECRVRVGFGDADSADGWRWSGAARVVSANARNDLAFLEAQIPGGATVRAATLTSTTSRMGSKDRFVSIGWPDLTVLKKQTRRLPPTSREYVKRFSYGSFLFAASQRQLAADAEVLAKRARVIYHNAPVLPGSSGGPLVNREGQVIGINTLILSTNPKVHIERSCSMSGPGHPPECVHVAVSSAEIMSEYEGAYTLRAPPLGFPVLADNALGEGVF